MCSRDSMWMYRLQSITEILFEEGNDSHKCVCLSDSHGTIKSVCSADPSGENRRITPVWTH